MTFILLTVYCTQSKLGQGFELYPPAMALMFVVGFVFMTLTYGTAAPTGLFIPSLVVGSCGGRLLGRGVK